MSVGNYDEYAQRMMIRFNDWLSRGLDPETELIREVREKEDREARDITLAELYSRFLDAKRGEVSGKTLVSYGTSRAHLEAHGITALRLSEVGHPRMRQYMRSRQAAGAAASTIHTEVMLVTAMCTWAVNEGMMPNHPLQRLECPRVRNRREVRLTSEQVAALVGAIKQPVQSLVVRFALASGRRKDEILGLRVEDVRLRDIGGAEYSVRHTKGGLARTFPASEWAVSILREAIGDRTEGWVFQGPSGGRYLVDWKVSEFKAAVKALGLTVLTESGQRKMLTFHDLRHVFATQLTDNGADIRDVQALLGQQSVVVTERYTARKKGHKALEKQCRIG
ncbi:site-specific integrase [bacterium]|nr:site-specific integrase [bacterium]